MDLKSKTLHSSFTSHICIPPGAAERPKRRRVLVTLMAAVTKVGGAKRDVAMWCVLQMSSSFHSSHVCLPGVIFKKVAQSTKPRLHENNYYCSPEMNILGTIEKIQRVGPLCPVTSLEAPSQPTYKNTWHQ